MIWIILAGIAIFFIVKMTVSYQKDNIELQERNLQEKFHVLIGRLNEHAFNNAGTITSIDKRECNLYKEGANQIITFLYSQGTLNITWKYKYFQKEIIHKKSFVNCRNLSLFEQGDMASSVIQEMQKVVEEHKNKVLPIKEDFQKVYDNPELAKQEFSELLYEFSMNQEALEVLENYKSDEISNFYTKFLLLLSDYIYSETREKLIIADGEFKFKSYTFQLTPKIIELDRNRGKLLFISNSLGDVFKNHEGKTTCSNKFIILGVEEGILTRWMFMHLTGFAHEARLFLLKEDDIVPCGNLPDPSYDTLVMELDKRLERTPTNKDWSDLMDSFYNDLG